MFSFYYKHVLVCLAFMHSVRSASQATVDPEEVRRFQSLAGKWWDEQGEFAALHAMNDLRVPFIRCVCVCVTSHNMHSNIHYMFEKPRRVTHETEWQRRRATVSERDPEEVQPCGISALRAHEG